MTGTRRAVVWRDSVFALVLALVVLDLAAPGPPGAGVPGVTAPLATEWPAVVLHLASVTMIAAIWTDHRLLLRRPTPGDGRVVVADVALLLTVGAIAFSTHVLAEDLFEPDGGVVGAAYSATMLAWLMAHCVLTRAVRRNVRGNGGRVHASRGSEDWASVRRGLGMAIAIYLTLIFIAVTTPAPGGAIRTVVGHAAIAAFVVIAFVVIAVRARRRPG